MAEECVFHGCGSFSVLLYVRVAHRPEPVHRLGVYEQGEAGLLLGRRLLLVSRFSPHPLRLVCRSLSHHLRYPAHPLYPHPIPATRISNSAVPLFHPADPELGESDAPGNSNSRFHDKLRLADTARTLFAFPLPGPEPRGGFRPLDGGSPRVFGARAAQHLIVLARPPSGRSGRIESDWGNFDVCGKGSDDSEFLVTLSLLCVAAVFHDWR